MIEKITALQDDVRERELETINLNKRNEELLQKYEGLMSSQYASSDDKLKKLVFELECKEKKILNLTQEKVEVGECCYLIGI
jgi:hypothetical protein